VRTQLRTPAAPDRNFHEQVLVIVGASSGIGRAIAFACRGASIVVAARRDEAFREVVGECVELDARAIAVPTDITSPEQMEKLASCH
jgi:NADP-dependent 3-hydroxy acid dehydrogenase YdfG